MQIVLIGTGNTATVLGRMFVRAGHNVVQVYGRTESSAGALAKELKTDCTTDLKKLHSSADLYLLAVSDNAIPSVAQLLNLHNKLLVHTAGSVPMETLKDASRNYGVLYPLQSLRKEVNETPIVPFLVDGSTEETVTLIQDVAASLSAQVVRTNDAQRMRYHLAAVTVNNFSNHLYTLVNDFCDKNGADFSLLLPLIQQLPARLSKYRPQQLQTGPAIRNDVNTIQIHEGLLNGDAALLDMYKAFTDSIRSYYNPSH